jgi:hypothetical protein
MVNINYNESNKQKITTPLLPESERITHDLIDYTDDIVYDDLQPSIIDFIIKKVVDVINKRNFWESLRKHVDISILSDFKDLYEKKDKSNYIIEKFSIVSKNKNTSVVFVNLKSIDNDDSILILDISKMDYIIKKVDTVNI